MFLRLLWLIFSSLRVVHISCINNKVCINNSYLPSSHSEEDKDLIPPLYKLESISENSHFWQFSQNCFWWVEVRSAWTGAAFDLPQTLLFLSMAATL